MEREKYIALAQKLAAVSGNIIRRYYRMPHLPTQTKPEEVSAIVTIADQEAEAAMVKILRQEAPKDGIIREEGENIPSQSGYEWVLDPIDGTAAFVRGLPTFGTLIGLVERGRNHVLLGLVNQPITQEQWLGLAGEPSRFNGQMIENPYVQEHHWALKDACLCSTTPMMFTTQAQQHKADALQKNCRRQSFGGDCYNYVMLAAGWSAAPMVILEADMKYYDFCALIPIIQGVGSVITDWQGKPLTRDSSEILATSNQALWQQALNCG